MQNSQSASSLSSISCMSDKDHVVRVDVAGFNVSASTMKQVAWKYNLNIFQLSKLRNQGEIVLRDGLVTLTYL